MAIEAPTFLLIFNIIGTQNLEEGKFYVSLDFVVAKTYTHHGLYTCPFICIYSNLIFCFV